MSTIPAAVKATRDVPASQVVVYPRSVTIGFGLGAVDGGGNTYECVPVSLAITTQAADGTPLDSTEYRLDTLLLAPAADLAAAAAALAQCKTGVDVLNVLAGIVNQGVKQP